MRRDIKVIFIDFGGVILLSNKDKLIADFSSDYGIEKQLVKQKLRASTFGSLRDKSIENLAHKIRQSSFANLELIDLLKSLNEVRIFIATNNVGQTTKQISKYKIPKFYDSIIGPPNIDSLKPSDKYFENLINTTKTEPSVSVFIDDENDNVEAAKALGINALAFKSLRKLNDFLH